MNAEVTRDLLIVGTVLLALAWIASLAVLWEIHMVPWNEGPYRKIGRVLFSKSAVIAGILTLSMVSSGIRLLGNSPPGWFEVMRLTVFGAIVPVLIWQWWVYRRTRRSPINDPVQAEITY